MSFARISGVWYSKKLIATARKTGIKPAKIYSTRVLQKTAEAKEISIGDKMRNKVTSVGKRKCKRKDGEPD